MPVSKEPPLAQYYPGYTRTPAGVIPKATRSHKLKIDPETGRPNWINAWTVALVKSNQDRAFARLMQARHVTTVIFLEDIRVKGQNQTQNGQRLMFPGYVFCYGKRARVHQLIRDARHTYDLFCPDDQFAVHRDLSALLQMTQNDRFRFLRLEKMRPGVDVQILEPHNLQGTYARVVEANTKSGLVTIQVSVIMGECATIEVDGSHLVTGARQ